MRRIVLGAAAVAVAAGLSGSAFAYPAALWINLGTGDFSGVSIQYGATTLNNLYVGSLDAKLDGVDIPDVYCVDLGSWITGVPTTYPVDVQSTAGLGGYASAAAWLYKTYAPTVTNGTQAGALQLSIWDAWYDGGDGLSQGQFRYLSGGRSGLTSTAAAFLASLPENPTAVGRWFNYDGGQNPGPNGGQDMLGDNPVPEPSTLMLGFTATVFGWGALRRRREAVVS